MELWPCSRTMKEACEEGLSQEMCIAHSFRPACLIRLIWGFVSSCQNVPKFGYPTFARDGWMMVRDRCLALSLPLAKDQTQTKNQCLLFVGFHPNLLAISILSWLAHHSRVSCGIIPEYLQYYLISRIPS